MSELLSKDQIFTRMNLEDWSSVEALLSCPQEAALESRTKNVPIRNAKWIIHGTMGVRGRGSVVIPQLPSKFQCHQTMLACATAMGNNCNRLSPWLSWICSLVLGVCVMRRSAQEHQLSQTPLFWPVWGTRKQNVWVPLRPWAPGDLGNSSATLWVSVSVSDQEFPFGHCTLPHSDKEATLPLTGH